MGSFDQDWQYMACITNMRIWNSYIQVDQFRTKQIARMELCQIESLPFKILRGLSEIYFDALRRKVYRKMKQRYSYSCA
jgi:hypothetical protein